MFTATLSSTGVASAQKNTFAEKIITGQYGFETDADSKSWLAQNSAVSFSPAHYKEGQRSLQWSWKKGALLQVPSLKGLKEAGEAYAGGQPELYEPSFYPKDRFGGIKIWLYQEKPAGGQLVFQVGSDIASAQKNPKYRFAVNLDFTGWRTVWACFEEDAKVKNYKGSDDMQALVAFPQNTKATQGQLFIDHLTLLSFISNKRNSDELFVNNKRTDLRSADAYEILKPWQAFKTATYSPKAALQQLAKESGVIAGRLEFLILGDKTADWKQHDTGIERDIAGKIKSALAYYDKLQLKTENGFTSGVPLFAIRDEHPAPGGLVFDDVAQAIMFPLAMDYKLNGNTASKEKLLKALDYFLDQGWAAGSGLGTVDHVIKMSPIATAIFLVRDELKAQQKLKPLADMLAWHTRLGKLTAIDCTRGENSDQIRGGAIAKLIAILLMDDDGRKEEMLIDFKKYMDYIALIAPGYSDTFKPDFSIYHHRGTYLNTYGTNALNTMALIHWLLQGTPYAMAATSADNIKQALVRQAEIAYGVQIHYGVGGRFPLGNTSIQNFTMPAYAYMSLADGKVNDKNFAALFNYLYGVADPKEIARMLQPGLTYSGTFGTLNLMVRAHRQMGAEVLKPSDGAVSMPFSGLMAYRSGKAFAAVKGYNKYVWDYESGGKENNLGRYLSHGMLAIGQGDEKEGFTGLDMNDGFDWSMLPGATTKMLPAAKMLYFTSPDNKYVEGKHRNFSESRMASGLRQERNGLFGFDLRDDVFPDEERSLFDSSFRAKKSYFFIGNEIICLGSGIQNTDARYHTVTTLFQYHTRASKENFINGKAISATVPEGQKVDGGWFTDQNGLQYIVPKGQNLVIAQGEQEAYRAASVGDQKKISLESATGYQLVKAPYTRAWFNHGAQPKDKGYEYEILLNTSDRDAQKYLHNKTYDVLQKNNAAHIIRHKTTGITAYTIFDAKATLAGILQNVSLPLLAMVKATETGESASLLLTIANPDLQQAEWGHNMSNMPDSITNSWSKGNLVTVTIKGEWHAAGYIKNLVGASVVDGNTVLVIYTRDGESIDIPLQHRMTGGGDE